MNLVALPARSENRHWMLRDGRQAFVVGPVDAAPAALVASVPGLVAILVKHHQPGALDSRAAPASLPVRSRASVTPPTRVEPMTGFR